MTKLQQALVAMAGGVIALAQTGGEPVNTAPNPYATVSNFFQLPAGRTWGATSAVEVDRDGKSVWIAERCGANSCVDPATSQIRDIPTVFLFDEHGNVVRSFGNGLLTFPHGSLVDRDGNLWITDGQDNRPRPAPGAPPSPPAAAQAPHPQATKGHQIFKFSPCPPVTTTPRNSSFNPMMCWLRRTATSLSRKATAPP
jgi:hypothetical protein